MFKKHFFFNYAHYILETLRKIKQIRVSVFGELKIKVGDAR